MTLSICLGFISYMSPSQLHGTCILSETCVLTATETLFTISLKHFFFLFMPLWKERLNPPPVFIKRRRLWRQRTCLTDKKTCISFRPFWQLTHFIAILTAFLYATICIICVMPTEIFIRKSILFNGKKQINATFKNLFNDHPSKTQNSAKGFSCLNYFRSIIRLIL